MQQTFLEVKLGILHSTNIIKVRESVFLSPLQPHKCVWFEINRSGVPEPPASLRWCNLEQIIFLSLWFLGCTLGQMNIAYSAYILQSLWHPAELMGVKVSESMYMLVIIHITLSKDPWLKSLQYGSTDSCLLLPAHSKMTGKKWDIKSTGHLPTISTALPRESTQKRKNSAV